MHIYIHTHTHTGLHIYWDVESTKEVMVAAEVRDVEWSTFTCVQGWAVQGIGPKFQVRPPLRMFEMF